MPAEPEYKTLQAMISLFCRHRHKSDNPCTHCSELLEYAEQRLAKCPFGDNKPTCRVCHIHCYAPEKRKRIAEVMRFSGPRMILHHPIMALRYLVQTRKSNIGVHSISERRTDAPSRNE